MECNNKWVTSWGWCGVGGLEGQVFLHWSLMQVIDHKHYHDKHFRLLACKVPWPKCCLLSTGYVHMEPWHLWVYIMDCTKYNKREGAWEKHKLESRVRGMETGYRWFRSSCVKGSLGTAPQLTSACVCFQDHYSIYKINIKATKSCFTNKWQTPLYFIDSTQHFPQ